MANIKYTVRNVVVLKYVNITNIKYTVRDAVVHKYGNITNVKIFAKNVQILLKQQSLNGFPIVDTQIKIQ